MVKASDLVAGCQQALDEQWGYIWGKVHEMWSEAKQAAYARDYAGDEKRKQSCEYGGKWAGHWVTDCSGLITYWIKHYGGTMYHGSNTMYLKWCTSKGELSGGKRTDGNPLKPGTAVFCYNGTKYSHVGIYVGGGGWVIEAAGSRQGVIRSKVSDSKWDNWGELKGVDYSGSTPEPAPDPQPDRPTLRRGSRGDAVRELQESLLALGYDIGLSGVDGIFGQATERAVKSLQCAAGLVIDGIVGPLTWAEIDRQKPAENKTYRVTISGVSKEQACELLKAYPLANVEEMV